MKIQNFRSGLMVGALAMALSAFFGVERAEARCCQIGPGQCSSAAPGGCNGDFFGDPSECVMGTCSGGTAPTATPINTVTGATPTNTPLVAATVTPTTAPGEAFCSDGFDNDMDGALDCNDSDCAGDGACVQGTPVVSNSTLPFLAIALGGLAVLQLTRRARRN